MNSNNNSCIETGFDFIEEGSNVTALMVFSWKSGGKLTTAFERGAIARSLSQFPCRAKFRRRAFGTIAAEFTALRPSTSALRSPPTRISCSPSVNIQHSSESFIAWFSGRYSCPLALLLPQRGGECENFETREKILALAEVDPAIISSIQTYIK